MTTNSLFDESIHAYHNDTSAGTAIFVPRGKSLEIDFARGAMQGEHGLTEYFGNVLINFTGISSLTNKSAVIHYEGLKELTEQIREYLLEQFEYSRDQLESLEALFLNTILEKESLTERAFASFEEFTPNTTKIIANESVAIVNALTSILYTATEDDIEDGIEPTFIQQLFDVTFANGSAGFASLIKVLYSSKPNPVIVAEILRWLPKKSREKNRGTVIAILRYGLASSSRWIRYGAALGLATLRDKSQAQFLAQAIAREEVPELKSDLEHILKFLEGN